MRKRRQFNRNRTLGIEALEDRTLMTGNGTESPDLIGVAWDSENSGVYRVDASTAEAVLIGNSGLGRLNSLAQDAQGTLYTAGTLSTGSGSTYVLATIEPLTGAGQAVGEIVVEGIRDPSITSMAFSPTGTLYAVISRTDSFDNRLITIDPETAATNVIATVPGDVAYGVMGLDFAPNGTLYGWGTAQDRVGLVTIDTTTGIVTDVDANVGAAGAPVQTLVFLDDGSLLGYHDRVVLSGFPAVPYHFGDLLSIDPDTGQRTLIATTGAPAPDIRGLAVYPTIPDDPAVSVEMDIKPDSDLNSINLASQGLIAVAILTTDDFDAADVDVSTVVWAGANVAMKEDGSYFSAMEDVDGDGDLDRVFHFRLEETVLDELYAQLVADDLTDDGILDSTRLEVELSLLGAMNDGQLFEGSDRVSLFLSGKAFRELLEELSD